MTDDEPAVPERSASPFAPRAIGRVLRRGPQPPTHAAGEGLARGGSPFADVRPAVIVALGHAVALLVWLVAGPSLPGGRWFAVHVFTLGVLTNAVLAFSQHFSRTLTRVPGSRSSWWLVVTNLGVVALLTGLPTGWRPVLVAGSLVVLGAVLASWWELRGLRRRAIGARFSWIVRLYERAHGHFVHAGLLGALLGLGVIPGDWYVGVRLAHLHGNVLGWGGLTLLATLVFFGPTMARTRILPGADDTAARAMRWGAGGLSAAVLAFLLLGLPGVWGTGARLLAAAGLAGYAVGATQVCVPVLRTVAAARVTAPRPLVLGVTAWFVVVVWLDVLVVATGAWRWMDALGAIALAGVLAQAIMATLVYLVPMLRGRTTGDREALRVRLEIGARTRAVLLNLGVIAVVLGAARLDAGLPAAALGWAFVGVAVVATVATGLWPLRGRAARGV